MLPVLSQQRLAWTKVTDSNGLKNFSHCGSRNPSQLCKEQIELFSPKPLPWQEGGVPQQDLGHPTLLALLPCGSTGAPQTITLSDFCPVLASQISLEMEAGNRNAAVVFLLSNLSNAEA